MEFRSVSDKSDFSDELDMSAEPQVKAMIYSVTGKARFTKKTKIKDEFLNIVVHAIVALKKLDVTLNGHTMFRFEKDGQVGTYIRR